MSIYNAVKIRLDESTYKKLSELISFYPSNDVLFETNASFIISDAIDNFYNSMSSCQRYLDDMSESIKKVN